MSNPINSVVAGPLGSDPELKYLPDGTPILKLSIASNSRRKVGGEWKESTTWIAVDGFGKRYEALAKILAKGKWVLVRGELSIRDFEHNGEKRYAVEMRPDDIQLVGKKDASQPSTASRAQSHDDGEDLPY
jgi:single-strand DNA-binding protein